MAEMRLEILSSDGTVKARAADTGEVTLVYQEEYHEGDRILFSTDAVNTHYIISLDDVLGEAFVYVTEPEFTYYIPFGEKRVSYSPRAFTGEIHLLTARPATEGEISGYRNLAKNVLDQHENTACYPHAKANVETRGESVFAARNAIDGVKANHSHGAWPYESWGINQQDDAAFHLSFGRPVRVDKLVLYTRADFPHDNWWTRATFTFSDGSRLIVSMEKSDKAHVFPIEPKTIEWLELRELIKADDPSPFPALSQIEVYGTEA